METHPENAAAHKRWGYTIQSPHGAVIEIPRTVAEDPHAAWSLKDLQPLSKFYAEQGYVVVRGLIPKELCDSAYQAFRKEVRPHDGFLYRQVTANPERHVFTPAGYMLNSLLNVQDLRQQVFRQFREHALKLLTHRNVQTVVSALFDDAPTLVQSMFFEGNPATWAHQDSYYLDSSRVGAMIGAWFAVEDIHPGAGRFFVYPKSHLERFDHSDALNIVSNHEGYKKLILETIRGENLQCIAPALKAGDVLFWGSLTIHGSLQTTEPNFSRASFTGHYIPASTQFVQYQKKVKRLHLRPVNGMQVNFPKDQNRFKNRLILKVETSFPGAFQWAKRTAIRLLIKTNKNT